MSKSCKFIYAALGICPCGSIALIGIEIFRSVRYVRAQRAGKAEGPVPWMVTLVRRLRRAEVKHV